MFFTQSFLPRNGKALQKGMSSFQQHEWIIRTDSRLASQLPHLKFPSPLISPKPWIMETDLRATYLPSGQPYSKALYFMKNQCHNIGFYEQRSVRPCS